MSKIFDIFYEGFTRFLRTMKIGQITNLSRYINLVFVAVPNYLNLYKQWQCLQQHLERRQKNRNVINTGSWKILYGTMTSLGIRRMKTKPKHTIIVLWFLHGVKFSTAQGLSTSCYKSLQVIKMISNKTNFVLLKASKVEGKSCCYSHFIFNYRDTCSWKERKKRFYVFGEFQTRRVAPRKEKQSGKKYNERYNI